MFTHHIMKYYDNIKNLFQHIMDFSHYIIKSSQYTIQMLRYIMRTRQHIFKCEQDIMMMVNQMFLFLTIRQFGVPYPCIPQFCYIKVGFKGYTLHGHVFMMLKF